MSGEREHDIYARRRARNWAVGLGLGALTVLIFVVTIVRLQENVINPIAEANSPQFRYRDAEELEAREAARTAEEEAEEADAARDAATGDAQ